MTLIAAPRPLAFGPEDQSRLYRLRGSNCGPGALAAIAGCRLETALDALEPEFSQRRATTETMMITGLATLGLGWRCTLPALPRHGLARILWDGPWLADPTPFAGLRHSHWIATVRTPRGTQVFDINAIGQGGWITIEEWREHLVPWLLKNYEPGASGLWSICDSFEIDLGP